MAAPRSFFHWNNNNNNKNDELVDSRQAEFDSIGRDVERWAEELLISSSEGGRGWKEVECTKALRHRLNPHGSTKQYVTWMRDSRGKHARENDQQNHPCMMLHATIDAPLEIVCRYLSQEHRYKEYNSLLVDQKDVEELTPHSKICWSQSKKLLFIQPRDFSTFCYHRWLRDGTQLVVSQACEHPKIQKNEFNGGFRAYGLRGATYIQRHPADASKTSITMLAHCSCGDDIPEWAVRTAVRILAPIKPFEIIHRINVGVQRARDQLERLEKQHPQQYIPSSVATDRRIRSSRPAGIAQMGYGCFWPQGGGLQE